MSQRTGGFTAGIQAGTSATSVDSMRLESIVREPAKSLNHPNWIPGYDRNTLQNLLGVEFEVLGSFPDGGVFVDASGTPVLALEAKYQGKDGNAIERWFKNYMVMQQLGVQAYITFCSGPGFFGSNTAERTLATAAALDHTRGVVDTPDDIWNRNEGLVRLFRWRRSGDARAEIPFVIDTALEELGL